MDSYQYQADHNEEPKGQGIHRCKIANLIRDLLIALGEDPTREGLKDTPMRVARFWKEFIDYDPGQVETSFSTESVNQLTILRVSDVWSMCEHHLLPFQMNIVIGYLARGKFLGASKFARVCYKHAHRLQIQEQFVEGVADEIQELTDSPDVAVYAVGRHTCMESRGVRNSGPMVTSVMRGIFLANPVARMEFLELSGRAE